MKVLSSLKEAKNRHRDCQIVKRRGRIYVICKSNPRFKARQGGAKTRTKAEPRSAPGIRPGSTLPAQCLTGCFLGALACRMFAGCFRHGGFP